MGKLKQRILTIDDEPGVCILLKRILEETGLYSVDSESDAFRAVWRARAFRPDILLIDVNMPGQTGIEIALQIRAEPWLRFRPIVFFTGLETRATPRLLEMGDGPTEFLAKGVPADIITATVGRLLAGCTGVAARH